MLGSLSEADAAVQEAWLRLSRSDASLIENLGGWLTTVVCSARHVRRAVRRDRTVDPGRLRELDLASWTGPEKKARERCVQRWTR
jgi:RNA polymerase sigma-70 factor (ECF subfamily)